MKTILFALCLMLVFAGTAMAYDDSEYDYSDYSSDYSDSGGLSYCCGSGFALAAVGAFALISRKD